ncbi:hypothetical protein M409DRAFT_19230 [Zasmidium cellare ATCC 36951]|uniref:Acetamidase/formamidase n=1 Tax=Zasmidium cellare ATCC 36951 TaxID=1080233 RepID=A0A6A6CW29_ZASCE|nr:uncharacterized protein M409DRAFT_19230 [Zasmidium cellare ATCC 36951]KAF2170408.1 hypothetical protein M409DRAFT_19230 [Zasmidium cellare ATCC 36951]
MPTSKHSFHIHRDQVHLKWTKKQPPALTVSPGDIVTFDCIDGSNYQVTPQSTSDAILNFDVSLADPVFGPVYVNGAEPGDALEIEVVELQTADWGWTAIVPNFGLLQKEFEEPCLKIWKLPEGRHDSVNGEAMTGVGNRRSERLAVFNDQIRIPLRPFMGTMGVAPGDDGEYSTIPPLETGGNIDCRHITEGTRLILPVRTPGALFSCGDGHAAQGDGEVCGSAIETPMKVTLRFSVLKNHDWVQSPHFRSPPESEGPRRVLPDRGSYSTMGIDSDLLEASRKAVRAMIQYLGRTRGLSRTDAYMLSSIAVDMRIAEIVDMPNHAVTATLPLNIFVDEANGTTCSDHP